MPTITSHEKFRGEVTHLVKSESRRRNVAAIQRLRVIVLSIDWEINETVMAEFLSEIARLEMLFAQDPAAVMMLKLLASVGRYIQRRKSQAHQGAVSLLDSMYHRFEAMVADAQMPQADKKRFVLQEIQNFRELKARIAANKVEPPLEKSTRARPATPPHAPGSTAPAEEIGRMLHAELTAIRQILERLEADVAALKTR